MTQSTESEAAIGADTEFGADEPDGANGTSGDGAGTDAAAPFAFLGLMKGQSELMFALGIVAILIALIMPLPRWLMDFSLAVSITVSVMILMTSLFIKRPLEFNAFPTVLLIATMLRLSLNMASTRLILSNGHEGTDAAGGVIEAFGYFVMGGNYVIGVIVFAILVIVNFVVITKGSGRIAEVAARFSLDAMPGKQMAIDADLSAGLIGEEEAKVRRSTLEDESSFFGAMDGAAKFVRGDAVAGLLITLINVIGGMIIGIMQQDMTAADAAASYTILTVGDGLVSQIPALIISTAAGLLVSKAGVSGSANKVVFQQLSSYPQALGVSSFLMFGMALLPGIPIIPFALIGLGTAGLAFKVKTYADAQEVMTEQIKAAEDEEEVPLEEPIAATLAMDQVRLELGYGLLNLIKDDSHFRLTEQIKALRRQLASELGFVMPSVRILDNMQLAQNSYVVRIKEIVAGEGELHPEMLLVMDPRGDNLPLKGEMTIEPTFGLPAMWVDEGQREEALFRGFTVVDPATVVTTHLTEIIKDNTPELLSYAETQKLLDDLPADHQKLVQDIVPAQISVSAIQRVLQSLLRERVSIRDLPTILEGIAEATAYTQNVAMVAEHVRGRLALQICNANATHAGYVPILSMSPEWEEKFADSLVALEGGDKQLAMAPSLLQQFIEKVRVEFEHQAQAGEMPVLLTSPTTRPFVRSIIERFRPATVVLSQNEIHSQARIRTLGSI